MQKEKTIVLDRRTKDNQSLECGDFVTCANCGRTMLVNIGETVCPECEEASLMWADEQQERSEDYFANSEDYILVDAE